MRKKIVVVVFATITLALAGCTSSSGKSSAPSGSVPVSNPAAPSGASTAAQANSSPSPTNASDHNGKANVKYFTTTLTPRTGVGPGTVLTAKSTGATASTSYYCVIAAYSTKQSGVTAPLTSSLKPVQSNAKGEISCQVTYQPFSAKDSAGVERQCPTTAADRQAGFMCGVALADAGTVGALSASVAPFTPTQPK